MNNKTVALGSDHAGYEFPALVEAGKTTDIGELQFITTPIPNEG